MNLCVSSAFSPSHTLYFCMCCHGNHMLILLLKCWQKGDGPYRTIARLTDLWPFQQKSFPDMLCRSWQRQIITLSLPCKLVCFSGVAGVLSRIACTCGEKKSVKRVEDIWTRVKSLSCGYKWTHVNHQVFLSKQLDKSALKLCSEVDNHILISKRHVIL